MIEMTIDQLFSLKCSWEGEHVYLLSCHGYPLYVGKTNQSPKARLQQHYRDEDLIGTVMTCNFKSMWRWKIAILSLSDCEVFRQNKGGRKTPITTIFEAETYITRYFDPLCNWATKKGKTLEIPSGFRRAFAKYRPDLWGLPKRVRAERKLRMP